MRIPLMNESAEHVMRSGLSQIELIFVILIVGILAASAIPRLAATRDDGKLSTTVHNMSVCVSDVAARYTASGTDATASDHPPACDLEKTRCYTITYGHNGQNFIVATNAGGADYCADIDRVGGHLAKTYNFGGSRISL